MSRIHVDHAEELRVMEKVLQKELTISSLLHRPLPSQMDLRNKLAVLFSQRPEHYYSIPVWTKRGGGRQYCKWSTA